MRSLSCRGFLRRLTAFCQDMMLNKKKNHHHKKKKTDLAVVWVAL